MTGSSTSQCFQAARRHLHPHHDSIWVPESLLASVFERYVATSPTGMRHASSVPGPMEHRKRLAKRRMGELHFGQSPAAAPIWELANLVDLTRWEWRPPSHPDAIRQRTMNPTRPRTLSDIMLDRLRALFPSRTSTTEESHEPDGALLPRGVSLDGVQVPLPSVSWDAHSTPNDVVQAALESLSQDISTASGKTAIFERFCNSWRDALTHRVFHGPAIGEVLTGIGNGLGVILYGPGGSGPYKRTQRNRRRFRTRSNRLILQVINTTIEGLSAAPNNQTTMFDCIAWNNTLHALSMVQMNTLSTFKKAIDCILEPSLKQVSSGIQANLATFAEVLGQKGSHPTTQSKQAAKMAKPLSRLGPLELRFIFDYASQKVLKYSRIRGVDYSQVRFSWLLLLARLPAVDEEYLAQTCNALEVSHQPLTDTQICRLFIVWASVRAPLERLSRLFRIADCSEYKYYHLSHRLWVTRQFHRVEQFVTFLYALGRDNDVILLAKGAAYCVGGEPSQLAFIALGMRRPRAAIEILCLYEECQRCKSHFWDSEFGFKALEILTWVPNVDHKKLWNRLGILSDKTLRIRWLYQDNVRGLSQIEKSKLAALGIVTGLSPHLTRRTAFSLMENCYANLRRHNTQLPLPFVRGLVRCATGHLQDGHPGTVRRLRYILSIVERQVGREAAKELALAIMQWRKSNLAHFELE
ncbi:hypothetical protein F4802DRAFT_161758 [Xylaria palmicola]|nr:hypothetical protein F4802DRAFT_161758 [Xylaria palmicola]